MQVLFATKNYGKLREVADIMNCSKIQILSLRGIEDIPHVVEDGLTFEENARKKARIYFDYFKIPSVADDSGLEVDQLNKAPGIYSARFAGIDASDRENNKKLILELRKFKEPHTARFICCTAFYDGNKFLVSHGTVEGKIVEVPRGENGFGYDPYFIPAGFKKTMGELDLSIKNTISHRSKAFKALKELIEKHF